MVMERLSAWLTPGTPLEALRRRCEEDFHHDTWGTQEMTYPQFVTMLSDIAALWCVRIQDYPAWFNAMVNTITRREVGWDGDRKVKGAREWLEARRLAEARRAEEAARVEEEKAAARKGGKKKKVERRKGKVVESESESEDEAAMQERLQREEEEAAEAEREAEEEAADLAAIAEYDPDEDDMEPAEDAEMYRFDDIAEEDMWSEDDLAVRARVPGQEDPEAGENDDEEDSPAARRRAKEAAKAAKQAEKEERLRKKAKEAEKRKKKKKKGQASSSEEPEDEDEDGDNDAGERGGEEPQPEEPKEPPKFSVTFTLAPISEIPPLPLPGPTPDVAAEEAAIQDLAASADRGVLSSDDGAALTAAKPSNLKGGRQASAANLAGAGLASSSSAAAAAAGAASGVPTRVPLRNYGFGDQWERMQKRGYSGPLPLRVLHVRRADSEHAVEVHSKAVKPDRPLSSANLVPFFSAALSPPQGLTRPPTIWIVGPPGSGRTTLATRIAERLGVVHIDVKILAERAIMRGTKMGKALDRVLRAGDRIPFSAVLALLEDAVLSDEAMYRGFVLDGLPDSKATTSLLRKWGRVPEFLVNLTFTESELLHRRRGLRFDPVTGITFSAADLDAGSPGWSGAAAPLASSTYAPVAQPRAFPELEEWRKWMRRVEGRTAEEEREEAAALDEAEREAEREELEAERQAREEEEAAEQEAYEAAEAEGLSPEEQYQQRLAAQQAAGQPEGPGVLAVSPRRWMPNPKRVRKDRLLTRPEEFPAELEDSVSSYVGRMRDLNEILDLYRPERRLDLDGRLPAPQLAEVVLDAWAHLRPIPEPTVVDVADAGGEDTQKEAALAEGTELTGPRQPARSGDFCPVELTLNRKLVPGNPELNVVFKGEVYLLSSPQCRDMFLANPLLYTSRDTSIDPKSMRILLVGPPLSGLSTVARHLAELYGIRHLNVADLAAATMRDILDPAAAKNSRANRIKNALRDGAPLPPSLYAEAVVRAVESEDDRLSNIEGKLDRRAPGEGGSDDDDRAADNDDEDDDDDDNYGEDGKGPDGLTRDERAELQARANLAALSSEFGWVLEGLPSDPAVAAALAKLGVLPHKVLVFEDGSNGAAIQARAERLRLNLDSGALVRIAPLDPSELSPDGITPALVEAAKPAAPAAAAAAAAALGNPAGGAALASARSQVDEDAMLERDQARVDGMLGSAHVLAESLPRSAQSALVKVPVDTLLERYNGAVDGILEPFRLAELPVTPIPCEGSLVDVVGLVRSAVDPLFARATASDYAGLEPSAQVLGVTGPFCPVALKLHGALVQGNPSLSALYRTEHYLCSSEENLAHFLANPSFYVPGAPDPVAPPAPHLYVTGPGRSGRSTQAARLAELLGGVPVIDVVASLRDHVLDHPGTPLAARVAEMLKEAERKSGDDIVDHALGDGEEVAEVLFALVKAEPYLSKGWILDGPALAPAQLDWLAERKVYVDAVVGLELPEAVAVKRCFKPLKELPPPEKVKGEEEEEGKAGAGAGEGEGEGEGDGEGEGEAEVEVDTRTPAERREAAREAAEALASQLAELNEERRSAAVQAYEAGADATRSLLDHAESLGVTVARVEGHQVARVVTATVRVALSRFVDERAGLFARAVALPPKEAEAKLRACHKALSKWGRHCPVQAAREGTLSDVFSSAKFPVLFREHIYFPASRAARDEFLRNPARYTAGLDKRAPPCVRPRLAVIGPTKSGRTTLSEALARELGVVHLSIRRAVEETVKSGTDLGIKIEGFLRKGFCVPDEYAVRALAYVLALEPCVKRGWVLDGFPFSAAQMGLMEEYGITPDKVYSLQAEPSVVVDRANAARARAEEAHAELVARWEAAQEDPEAAAQEAEERGLPPLPAARPERLVLHDSVRAYMVRYESYMTSRATIEGFYGPEQRNIMVPLQATDAAWKNKAKALAAAREVVRCRQDYLAAMHLDAAACVHNLGVLPSELKEAEGHFGRYDPVCLASLTRKQLHLVGRTTEFTAVYRGRYYHMKGRAELASFLEDPEFFIRGTLPDALPEHLPEDEARTAAGFELQGHCGVTLANPKLSGYDSIVLGDPVACAVRYDGRLFAMAGESELAAFMVAPWLYDRLTLPHKIPAPPQDPLLDGLPIQGYLEQVVARVLTQGLTVVAKTRPAFPYRTIKESALKHLALFLRANNPAHKNNPLLQQRTAKKLKDFEGYCQLVGFLKKNSPLLNPQLHHTPSSLLIYERRAEMLDRVQNVDMNGFFF
jgi:adenylate kinase family enzyme/YHS domain-containing protein